MKKDGVIIVGAGGHAREMVELARSADIDVVGVLDDFFQQASLDGVPVLGAVKDCSKYPEYLYLVAVGNPRIREKIVELLESELPAIEYATLIHPLAVVSSTSSIAEGGMVTAGCVISVGVNIGKHSIININSSLSHEVVLGDFCTVAPNVAVAGNVRVEGLVELGIGSSVKQGLKLGKGSLLGMGAVLLSDAEPNSVMAGVPAKKIRVFEEE